MHDIVIAAPKLVHYEAMVLAIDECHRVDDVKDIRDQARALEEYAKQALNTEAERKATEIRIRAERKAGELLKDLDKSKGGDRRSDDFQSGQREPIENEYKSAKREANISDTQAKRWQKLAEIPKSEFERTLQDPQTKPSTTGLINQSQAKPLPDDALWFWGRLRDFERQSYFDKDVNDLVSEMSDGLQNDVRRIVPQLMDWLGELN